MSICKQCGGDAEYNDRHDSFFCAACDVWTESKCSDSYRVKYKEWKDAYRQMLWDGLEVTSESARSVGMRLRKVVRADMKCRILEDMMMDDMDPLERMALTWDQQPTYKSFGEYRNDMAKTHQAAFHSDCDYCCSRPDRPSLFVDLIEQ